MDKSKIFNGDTCSDVWTNIFPRLSMAELIDISKWNAKLGDLVDQYLKSGGNLLIDDKSLAKYSIADSRFVYEKFGQLTTSVTLKKVPESDVKLILGSLFKSIQILTLDSLVIVSRRSDDSFGKFLQKVKLVNCAIHQRFLEQWLAALSPTLECLHLEGVACHFSNHPAAELSSPAHLFLAQFPKLTELMLHDVNFQETFQRFVPNLTKLAVRLEGLDFGPMILETIETLDIVAKRFISFAVECPSLKHLTLDVPCSREEIDKILMDLPCVDTLQTMVLHTCPTMLKYLKRFVNLEELSIKTPLDYKIPILRMHLLPKFRTLNVTHYNDPIGDQCNLILKLNEDCLIRIFNLLSFYDCLSVAQVHNRFEDIIGDYRLSHTHIRGNYGFLERFPLENEGMYKVLGKYVSKLTVSYMYEPKDVIQMLKPFQNLRTLHLSNISLTAKESIEDFPAGIQDLVFIDRCNIDKSYLRKIFQKLNPTLTNLVMESYVTSSQTDTLSALTNIRDVYLCAIGDDENLIAFIRDNAALEKLTLRINSDTSGRRFWLACSSLAKLQTLNLQFNRGVTVPPFSAPIFTNLTDLSVSLYGIQFLGQILDLVGPQLKKLSVESPMSGPKFVEVFSKRFPNLLELCFLGVYYWKTPDYEELMTFKSISSLKFAKNFGLPKEMQNLLQVLKELPLLTDFSCPDYEVKDREKLNEYLEANHRSLTINGVKFRVEMEESTLCFAPKSFYDHYDLLIGDSNIRLMK